MVRRPLRFASWKDLCYTDGSKADKGLTGSVVHPTSGRTALIHLKGHEGQINTAVRGELAALLPAVTDICPGQPLTILTDCQTAQWNTECMRACPERHRDHKHEDRMRCHIQLLGRQPTQLAPSVQVCGTGQ